MRKALKTRGSFLKFNWLFVICWLAFVWGNDFFYSKPRVEALPSRVFTLQPPASIPLPTTELKGNEELEKEILEQLNLWRSAAKLAPLAMNPVLQKLARGIAANKLQPEREQLDSWGFELFPKEEWGLIQDSFEQGASALQDPARDVASLWLNRRLRNGLAESHRRWAGVGVVEQEGRSYFFLISGEKLFEYDQPFGGNGLVSLSARRAEGEDDLHLSWRATHIKRGWLKPLVVESEEAQLPDDPQVGLSIPVGSSKWTLVEFLRDGRPLHSGRPVLGQ